MAVDIIIKALKQRANSYHRDSQKARDLGDAQAFAISLTVADELRKCIEFALAEVDAIDSGRVTSYADFCGVCAHHRDSHIYEEGACRPAGVVCQCASFQPERPDVDADMRRARAFVDDKTRSH